MHVQVINLSLNGWSYSEWSQFCGEVAPAIAALPGLISKVWLESQETNTYGGVYLWRDRQAMAAAMQTEVFQALPKHPKLANIVSKDFGVIEGPTRVTRGLVGARA